MGCGCVRVVDQEELLREIGAVGRAYVVVTEESVIDGNTVSPALVRVYRGSRVVAEVWVAEASVYTVLRRPDGGMAIRARPVERLMQTFGREIPISNYRLWLFKLTKELVTNALK